MGSKFETASLNGIAPPVAGAPLSLLVDSNVFIAAEDHGAGGHVFGEQASELIRLSQRLQYRLLVSNGTRTDLLSAGIAIRARRNRALEKYDVLPRIDINAAIRSEFPGDISRNNLADLEVLSALAAGAASWLVTNDSTMRARARRAGLQTALSIEGALELLRPLVSTEPVVPSTRIVRGYEIRTSAAIFDSLREDYEFDVWWREKVCAQQRNVIVLGDPHDPEGIGVLKVEIDRPHGFSNPTLKICTFKVSDEFRGSKRGELLLKAVIGHARRLGVSNMYLEALPTKVDLLEWLEAFGFMPSEGATTIRGEVVMRKFLRPVTGDQSKNQLERAVTYGPGFFQPERAHVVPIRNGFHTRLLPEADTELGLFEGNEACGNAIRKAYLCHAPTRRVQPGDALLFQRTGDRPAVTTVGVVEESFVSNSAEEIIKRVGTRTVYTANEIRTMCDGPRDVLALLFRYDRTLEPAWTRESIQHAGLINGWPQSISEVSERGMRWVRGQLDGSR
ncbi:GNAT family N-acetyltransferase [Rhodococcus sp. no. 34]